MVALGNVAVIYNSFEEAGGNLEDESAKGETLHDDENTAMEDLAKALQQRDRRQNELRGFQENLDNANMEVNNCWDKLSTAAIELKKCREGLDTAFIELSNCQHLLDRKTVELKRKATDAHDRTRSHWDRCWRATHYLMTVEGELNESLGKLGQAVKDTAGPPTRCLVVSPTRDAMKRSTCRRPSTWLKNSKGEALKGVVKAADGDDFGRKT